MLELFFGLKADTEHALYISFWNCFLARGCHTASDMLVLTLCLVSIEHDSYLGQLVMELCLVSGPTHNIYQTCLIASVFSFKIDLNHLFRMLVWDLFHFRADVTHTLGMPF